MATAATSSDGRATVAAASRVTTASAAAPLATLADADLAVDVDVDEAGPDEAEGPEDGDTAVASAVGAETSVDDDVITIRFPVTAQTAGWRLDHFLRRRIPRLSRTRAQAIIGSQITLEGGRRVRSSTTVHAGDVVVIRRPIPAEPDVPRTFEVLVDDPSFLALDKPSGLPIHTTAKFFRNTLTAVLRERYPGQKLDVAHRLDCETSGVLLVARSHAAASVLKQAFARRRVAKTYLALVKGQPPDRGVIDAPMRLVDSKTRILMGVRPDGLPSVTRYRVLRRFERGALVEAEPETGRQHQIRVHLTHIGHPIVGDKLYGAGGEAAFMAFCDGGMTPDLLASFDGLARHALHAHSVTFPHPVHGTATTVKSPWPADLTAFVNSPAWAGVTTDPSQGEARP